MKYIIYSDPNSFGMQTPIIFPDWVKHKDAAEGKEEVISGGFVDIFYDEEKERISCRCHGEATSLGVRCEKDDNTIISCALRLEQ